MFHMSAVLCSLAEGDEGNTIMARLHCRLPSGQPQLSFEQREWVVLRVAKSALTVGHHHSQIALFVPACISSKPPLLLTPAVRSINQLASTVSGIPCIEVVVVARCSGKGVTPYTKALQGVHLWDAVQ